MTEQIFPQYFEILPARPLLPYIECYWSRVSEDVPSSHLVLPDGCIDIIFNFGEYHQKSNVVGTMSVPLMVNSTKRIEFLGVRFRPGKASKFLRVPASELTNTFVALNEFWGKRAKILEDQLSEQNTIREKVDLLEKELLHRMQFGSDCDGSFETALQMILSEDGITSIDALSSHLSVSRQHLTRKFQQYIGIGPKLFSRIIRFQNLRKNIRSVNDIIWSQAALDYGFYDQAHMIADFKEFTGLTPEQYFSRG